MSALWERADFRAAAGGAWRPGGRALTRRALDWCEARGLMRPPALAQDWGCGGGATLELLAARGYVAVGLDRGDGPEGGGAAASAFVRADLRRPPLAEGCADMVLCECVLSLLDDPLAVLRAACRVLRAGGIGIVGDLTLRAEEAGRRTGREGGASCLKGARPAAGWRDFLEKAGFGVLLYEDHSRALVELAARMLWYGDGESGPAASRLSAGTDPAKSGACACALSVPRRYGYGLWIARKKEAVCTP